MDGIIIEREDQAVRSVAITQPIHNSCKYLTQQESGHNYSIWANPSTWRNVPPSLCVCS